MNNGAKAFRSALGGYHREDVNAYIKETDLKHSAELEEMKRTLEEAKAETSRQVTAAEKAVADRNSAQDELQAERIASAEMTRQKNAEIAELTKRLNLLKAETEAQSTVISSLREEKSQLSGELESVKSACAAEKKEAEDKLKSLRSEYEAQQETIAVLQVDNETLATSLNQAVSNSAAVYAEIEVLNNKAAELETRLADALGTIDEKNAEIAGLHTAHEEAMSACIHNALGDVTDRGSDAYKLEMYDKVSSQLGDILIGANRNADEIVAAARAEAEKIRMDADLECEQMRSECSTSVTRTRTEVEEEAAYIRERLSFAASDLLSSVSGDLHTSVENCIRELAACVEDMQYEIRALLSRLTSRSAEMNDRIDYYQTCVSDGVLERLAAMDAKYGIRHMTEDAGQTDGENHVKS